MSSTRTKCPCNPEEGIMQAITAILNPDTVDRADKQEEMLLFQSLPNFTLGYDQFEVDDGDKIKTQERGGVVGYYDSPKNLVPILKFQSKLISMKVDNIVNVYGVLETGQVCLMSPVFMPIPGLCSQNGIIAGTSDGRNAIWIYYQESGNIMERSLVNLKAKPKIVVEASQCLESTDIVAFWDGNHRWIAYQTPKNYVKVYCQDTDTENKIEDSDSMTGGHTKLAAVQTPLADGMRIYLYLTKRDFQLYRAYADTRNGAIKFSQPKKLVTNVSVTDYTWFDVEADAKKGVNLIYAVAEGESKITCTEDKWA